MPQRSRCNCQYGSCKRCKDHVRSGLDYDVWLRLYRVAYHAVDRCTNPDHPAYDDYGGRGIAVFQEWIDDIVKFAVYLSTLSGHNTKGLFVDRIENDKGYVPGNLRFTTKKVSANNRRRRKIAAGTIDHFILSGDGAKMLSFHDRGWKYKQIGKIFGTTDVTARKIIRRLRGYES